MKTAPFCIDGLRIYEGPIDITVRSRPGVIYYNQDFSGLSLTNASLDHTTFVNCDLSHVNLRFTFAKSATFTGCNLSSIDTFNSDFTKVRFTNSNLTDAQLYATLFHDCDLGVRLADASVQASFATPDTPLPSGLCLTTPQNRRPPAGLLAIEYDYEYLSQFASVATTEMLLAEHPDISLTRLIACLRALSPVPS